MGSLWERCGKYPPGKYHPPADRFKVQDLGATGVFDTCLAERNISRGEGARRAGFRLSPSWNPGST